MSVTDLRPAALYCRISSDPKDRRLGVDRQEEACRDLAARAGWSSVEVYVDNDFSAFSGVVRPAYHRMLDDLQLGRLAAVVAWDADRLHRSARELEDFMELAGAADVPVLMVTSGYVDFDTATGRLNARIKGTISRYESEHKTERIKAGMASLASAGRWKGGPRPYGYDMRRDNHGRPLVDGTLVIVPEEAAIVREAAARILAGESVYRVCLDLNKRSIPTVRGGPWRTPTLRGILTGPHIIGKRLHHGEVVGDAQWPGLIDEQTWQRLKARLLPDGNGPRRTGRRTYLLTGGIAVCGACGANLQGHMGKDKYRAYFCQGGPDKNGCGGVMCSAFHADRLVVSAVLDRPDYPDGAGGPADVPGGDRDMGWACGSSQLANLFVRGQLSPAAWHIISAGIAAVETRPALAWPDTSGAPHPVVLDAWEHLPLKQRRDRIMTVLDRVVISPTTVRGPRFDASRVSIEWRAPPPASLGGQPGPRPVPAVHDPDRPLWWTPEQAAEAMGGTVDAVYRAVDNGWLSGYSIAGRVLLRPDDVTKLAGR